MSKSVYEIVTERIIQELEEGRVPWRKPWSSAWAPKNVASKRDYRGINYVLLCSEVERWECPYFATRNQIYQLGGQIKKDQWKNSSIVTFWKILREKGENEETTDTQKSTKSFPLLRYYRVWNLAQTEGIEWSIPEESTIDPIEACENIVNDYEAGPSISSDGGNEAFYRPSVDKVSMPHRNSFKSSEAYYGTLFHECIHSTGHQTRLARDLSGGKYSKAYAREELTAEMGAALLLGQAGIMKDPLVENTGAYLRGWIQTLRDDPKCLALACGKAQKAADWILGKRESTSEEIKEAA